MMNSGFLRWLLLVLLLIVFAAACSAIPTNVASVSPNPTDPDPMVNSEGAAIPTQTLMPTATQTPGLEPARIAVPEQWESVVEEAIAQANGHYAYEVIIDPGWGLLSEGNADLALVPGDDGVFAGERIMALGVPLTSEWEDVTYDQAQEMIAEASPFVAILDWADITPTLKSLKIDGLHPGDPEYALKQRWAVIAAPGYEAAAEEIGPLIAVDLSIDAATHLVAVGDIMMDRHIGERISNGYYIYPFELVFDDLSTADITVGNLECALGDQGAPVEKGYTFRAPVGAVNSFAISGFDLLSLANNHAMDYGSAALLDAISRLEASRVQTVGAGENASAASTPVVLTTNDTSIAFLAYVDVPVEVRGFDTRSWTATANQPGLSWAEPEQMEADIASVREIVDIVVVLLHSGYEYVIQPSPPQVSAAHTAIDAGADLVVGHHAHVLQGIEFYNQGVIVYGLGNFVFDDGDIPQTALLNVWLDQGGVREIEVVPMIITEDGRPRLAVEDEAAEILAVVYRETKEVVSP